MACVGGMHWRPASVECVGGMVCWVDYALGVIVCWMVLWVWRLCIGCNVGCFGSGDYALGVIVCFGNDCALGVFDFLDVCTE